MSSFNSFLSPRALMGAAIVGLVGAAGMFIYEQVYAEKRRTMLVKDMKRLDLQVASMRAELESLRELQKASQLKRQKHKKIRERAQAKKTVNDQVDAPHVEHSYASDSEYYTDYQSVAGTDIDSEIDDEFYDVHSDSDDTLRETLPIDNYVQKDVTNHDENKNQSKASKDEGTVSNGAARGGSGDGLDEDLLTTKEKLT